MATISTINNSDSGLNARTKLNNNFSALNTQANTNTTDIATNASDIANLQPKEMKRLASKTIAEINGELRDGFYTVASALTAVDSGNFILVSDSGTVSNANCSYLNGKTLAAGDWVISVNVGGSQIWYLISNEVGGGGGSVSWGSITGTLSAQTDLQSALDAKIEGVAWGDVTGTLSAQTDLQNALNAKQNLIEVVSASKTAENDAYYVNVASATYTDPTPTEGKGFIVFVRNGTATIGGTDYAVAGSIIHRVFHSGAWANYLYQVGSTFATAAQGALADSALQDLFDDPTPTAGGDLDMDENYIVNGKRPIITESTTARTLALADAGDFIVTTNAGATTITIPTNASVAFSIGTEIDFIQKGAGALTVAGDTGVTLNGVSAGSTAITAQWGGATIKKIATDEWIIVGKINDVA